MQRQESLIARRTVRRCSSKRSTSRSKFCVGSAGRTDPPCRCVFAPSRLCAKIFAHVGRHSFTSMRNLVLLLVSLTTWPLTVVAGEWPGWRGPGGNGICQEKRLPLHWSTNENVLWHVPLPDRGNSTPIVWNRRVFITQTMEKENRRTVMCFDRRDGKLLWQAGPTWTENELAYPENPPCTPSPVSDSSVWPPTRSAASR